MLISGLLERKKAEVIELSGEIEELTRANALEAEKNQALRARIRELEESFEGTAVMKATDGTAVSVSVTEEATALFDMPTMTMDELVHLAVFFAYADMRADASVGVWVPYTAKIASAFKKGDDVLTLKSSAGDVITVDRASQTATLKTTEGAVFPLGREPEEQTTRRLAVIQLGRGRQNRRRGRGGFMAYGGAIVFGGAANGGGR